VEWRRSELPLELEVGGKGGHSAQAGKGEMEWGCRLHVTQRIRERGGRGPDGAWGSMGKGPGASGRGDQRAA
jgi:hypothetical protein